MLQKTSIIAAAALIFMSSFSFAEERGQGRLFLGSTTVDPKETNEALRTQGLDEFKMNNQLGLEITQPVFKFLQAGFRYTYRPNMEEENPADSATDYKAILGQQVFTGVARAPIVNTDVVKFDIVLGAGVTNTELQIKTASVDGKLERTGYKTPTAFAGGTLGFGYKKFFFTIEAGYEMNKVTGLKPSNMTSNIDSMDLSGGYLLVGLLFDDVPIFKK